MKHEESSLHTKKALTEALKKAMKQKPFHKITVSELIRNCAVNRKTFYYHFEDIYALLKWTLEEEAIEVVKHFDLMVDYQQAITFVMDYVERNDYIISCARDSMGRDELKRFFYTDFHEIMSSILDGAERESGITLDKQYKEFLIVFYMEALTGILMDWVRNHDKRDRETVVGYIYATIRQSLRGVLRHCPDGA